MSLKLSHDHLIALCSCDAHVAHMLHTQLYRFAFTMALYRLICEMIAFGGTTHRVTRHDKNLLDALQKLKPVLYDQ